MSHIHSAAVLGSGTMGAQIAALLANAGVPVLLLDLDRDTAEQGLRKAQKLKPSPFFTTDAVDLIDCGGFDNDLHRIKESDWIIEAVVEQLQIKQELVKSIERYRSPGSIVSSNTSGIPIASIVQGRSEEFRRHWLGTHFFNPPRYLRLLEIIPTRHTDEKIVETIRYFGDKTLGKGVVVAKDTPNFIGNRIGVFGVMRVLQWLTEGQLTIEEIDAITGPLIGRPKSATFRTMDIAGVDVLAHVARNLSERLPEDERVDFTLPPLINEMIERGWLGEKTGQGFYKKERTKNATTILTLDPSTMTYRKREPVHLPGLESVKAIEDLPERLQTLFLDHDRIGEFLRAAEKLGVSVEYFCEEFIFDCDNDAEQLERVHDDEHLNIAEFNALYWEV